MGSTHWVRKELLANNVNLFEIFGSLKEKSYWRNYRRWCERRERASVQFFLTKTLLIYIGCPKPHFHPTTLKNSTSGFSFTDHALPPLRPNLMPWSLESIAGDNCTNKVQKERSTKSKRYPWIFSHILFCGVRLNCLFGICWLPPSVPRTKIDIDYLPRTLRLGINKEFCRNTVKK